MRCSGDSHCLGRQGHATFPLYYSSLLRCCGLLSHGAQFLLRPLLKLAPFLSKLPLDDRLELFLCQTATDLQTDWSNPLETLEPFVERFVARQLGAALCHLEPKMWHIYY